MNIKLTILFNLYLKQLGPHRLECLNTGYQTNRQLIPTPKSQSLKAWNLIVHMRVSPSLKYSRKEGIEASTSPSLEYTYYPNLIAECLRMLKDLLINWNPCWFTLWLIGPEHGVLIIVLLFLSVKILLDLLSILLVIFKVSLCSSSWTFKYFSSSIKP